MDPLHVAALAGAVSPLLVALGSHSSAETRVRALLGLGFAFLTGLGTMDLTDGFDPGDLSTFAVALAAQLVAYKTLWDPVLHVNETVAPEFGVGHTP